MKYWKVVVVSVLLAVPCVLLAWGAVAIGQSAGIVEGTPSTPPQPARTPIGTSVGRSGGGMGARGGMLGSDPLKDVADLAQAKGPQLEAADRYLESKTRGLAQQYAGSEDEEAQAKLKTELTQTIEKHFDVRHEIRKREIAQLEARVKQLREHLAKRGAARQSIVEMRLGQFISAAEGLGWDTDFGRARSSFSMPGGAPPLPPAPSSNTRGLFPPRPSAKPARR